MVEILSTHYSAAVNPSDLLAAGEVVAVVDDSPEIILILTHYLNALGLDVVQASNGAELNELFAHNQIALLLLDLGLPDKNGEIILNEIVPSRPNLGIIVVTGTTDVEIALSCLRKGADDYLTKPVSVKLFNHSVINTLKKRRLAINSRAYQRELQLTNTRMRFLHHLNLKMNTAYLNTFELERVLQAILVGITADDGLRFNRAFLALYDQDLQNIEGRMAIGPSSHEKAGQIWHSLKEQDLRLDNILEKISKDELPLDKEVNDIIRQLRIATDDHEHIFIQAINRKKPVFVQNGQALGCKIPKALIDRLQESTFVVVPLYSPSQPFGVIIVDNYITKDPINYTDIRDLEIFASQASIAIEHSHLYEDMAEKIQALEFTTRELERNRDLLVEAERIATIGKMSSQLLHTIRNPLTSIGGTSRLLTRKSKDPYISTFLKIITDETNKIERTLDDLFTFVVDTTITPHPHPLYSLVRKIVMVFYTTMKEQSINYKLSMDEVGPEIPLDENKIRQLFLHLLRNSIEAMQDGGSLHIDAKEDDFFVSILIYDTGYGIPPEDLHHVTDPFFSTKTKGKGMGLAIVDQIAKAHGGEFFIENNPSGGTIATIRLPKSTPTSGDDRGNQGEH